MKYSLWQLDAHNIPDRSKANNKILHEITNKLQNTLYLIFCYVINSYFKTCLRTNGTLINRAKSILTKALLISVRDIALILFSYKKHHRASDTKIHTTAIKNVRLFFLLLIIYIKLQLRGKNLEKQNKKSYTTWVCDR